jgi:hypothetical protein
MLRLKRHLAEAKPKYAPGKYLLPFTLSSGDQAWGQMKEGKKKAWGKEKRQMCCPVVPATGHHILGNSVGLLAVWEEGPLWQENF